MRNECFTYEINNKTYDVFVTYKRQRNIYFRLKEDGFHISAPVLASKKTIVDGLDKFAYKLAKNYDEKNFNFSINDGWFYLFGKKCSLKDYNLNNIDEIEFFIKVKLLEKLPILVRKYEKIMGVKNPYKINVRKTATRLGSNSLKTHSLSFQLNLGYYSEEIISSVVVHELAHDFYRNHQKDFYNCVYLYCPNYNSLTYKLKKGIHE